MSTNDGWPAFPRMTTLGDPVTFGMSLRDYFASQAMWTAHSEITRQMGEGDRSGFGWENVSEIAYRLADAMLAERAK